MKYELPENHGLSDKIIGSLVYTENGSAALTDSQYAALESGLGLGKSVLVVSPTSTGKTQIAVWAIASGIEVNANTVYLVTHRALAKQKFNDFKDLLLTNYLNSDPSCVVLATGDVVMDCSGETPADPLRSPVLIATYEKYLAMLSASGVPSSLGNTVVVCDEIQLLGDKHRGQNVEILLTLLRNAGWKQFVGLSAVLEEKDSEDLSNWLKVSHVRTTTREKDLRYEYWNSINIESVSTSSPEDTVIKALPTGVSPETLKVIRYLENRSPAPLPVIVFCMRKQDIYDLATADLEARVGTNGAQLPLDLGDLPETTANSFLATALSHRIAIHSADLTDDERKIVEDGLIEGKVDVVYATSTLAAGVNFPLGAAVFHSWVRWDGNQRTYMPIDPSEFHNMAGRVGRMGSDHEEGRVIFFPTSGVPQTAYKSYLQLDVLPPIQHRINVENFDQLSLQLIATGLCATVEDIVKIIKTSFSGLREEDKNLESFETWDALINDGVGKLIQYGFVVKMTDGRLIATPVGKSVGHSGFRPISAVMLVEYFSTKGNVLASLIGTPINNDRINRFAYLIFAASFSIPEFRPHQGKQPSRFLPWSLKNIPFDASSYADDLFEPNWFADLLPTNAAQFSLDWINGAMLVDQEKTEKNIRAGTLLEMYRNLGWVLQGISLILSAASDKRTPEPLRPKSLQENESLISILRKLPRAITRLSYRVATGLPDDVLWMNTINQTGEPFKVTRDEIIGFREKQFSKPELLVLGDSNSDHIRCAVFEKAKPAPQVKANWFRDRCRSWKSDQRIRAQERHQQRARGCSEIALIQEFYEARGDEFELAFEEILTNLGIGFNKLDDNTKTGAPDYLIQLKDSPPLIFELKTREGNNLINYNGATEVLAASEIHGHKDTFCVTLCQPGVDPSVPMNITGSGRLSVVESNDLGEGLLRLCQGKLTQEQLWQWFATPGQALSADLPYKEN